VTEPVPEWRRRWDALLWEPDGDVLRNKLGIRNNGDLDTAEYRIRAVRQLEIERGDVEIPRTFGQQHQQALHKHLFQDVYEWAGQFREVNMAKTEPFAPHQQIPNRVNHVQGLIQPKDWPNLSRDEFVQSMSEIYAYQNVGHPFREGNGTVGKILISQVAEQSPYRLDFDKIERASWDRASRASMPERAREQGPDPSKLVPVFDAITVEREPAAAPALDPELARAVALQNSTYAAASAGASTSSSGSSLSSTVSASSSEASANSPGVQAPSTSGIGERPQTHGAAAYRTDRGSGRGE
jgi:cell filamentation protein